jgi:hypothetical protein
MVEKKDETAAVNAPEPEPVKKPVKPVAEKRAPADWAARMGLLPGGKPSSALPVGITPAVYAGASRANRWGDKPLELTPEKFVAALETWFRAPTAHSLRRQRLFERRVAAINAEKTRVTGVV